MIKKNLTAHLVLAVLLVGLCSQNVDAARRRRTIEEARAQAVHEWTEADIVKGRDTDFVAEVTKEAALGADDLARLLKKKKLKKYPAHYAKDKTMQKQVADYYKDIATAIEDAVKASSGKPEAKELADDFKELVKVTDTETKKVIDTTIKLDDAATKVTTLAVAPGGGAAAVAAQFADIKTKLNATAAAVKDLCDDIALATNAPAKFKSDDVKKTNSFSDFENLVTEWTKIDKSASSDIATHYNSLADVKDKQDFVDEITKFETDSKDWVGKGTAKEALLAALQKMQQDAIDDEKSEIEKVLAGRIGYKDAFENSSNTTIKEFMEKLEQFLKEFDPSGESEMKSKDVALFAIYEALKKFYNDDFDSDFKKPFDTWGVKTVAEASDLKKKIDAIVGIIKAKQINSENVFDSNTRGIVSAVWHLFSTPGTTRTHNSKLNEMYKYASAESVKINAILATAGGIPDWSDIQKDLTKALKVKAKIEAEVTAAQSRDSTETKKITDGSPIDYHYADLAKLDQKTFNDAKVAFDDIKKETDASSFVAKELVDLNELKNLAKEWNQKSDKKPKALLAALKAVVSHAPPPPVTPSTPAVIPPAPVTPSTPAVTPSPSPVPSAPSPAPSAGGAAFVSDEEMIQFIETNKNLKDAVLLVQIRGKDNKLKKVFRIKDAGEKLWTDYIEQVGKAEMGKASGKDKKARITDAKNHVNDKISDNIVSANADDIAKVQEVKRKLKETIIN